MAQPTDWSSRLLSVILSLTAVAIAASVVRREFFPRTQAAVPLLRSELNILREPAWEEILSASIPADTGSGRVLLIEFVDLECPFCRRFHLGVLQEAREEFGDRLAVAYVHWPLPIHRFARPAAEAAECAALQGRFGSFVDAVFRKQDSLGLKSWSSYATEAGVADSSAFRACLRDPAGVADRIESGTLLAERLGYTGTPTVLVNGWHFTSPPTAARLLPAIQAVLDGRDPEE